MAYKVSVVATTYNERDNLEPLVKKIFALKIPDLLLTIVDDNSPDGTGVVAEKLSKKYPIKVIHREKKLGAGSAYITAFKELLKINGQRSNGQGLKIKDQRSPELIIQMDADLSHAPEEIPKLLAQAENYDLVLGSRYVAGGAIEEETLFHRLLSRLGNLYARLFLKLPYRDITGGFKCYRRAVLAAINFDIVSPIGYLFQMDTLYQAHKLGFKITEIPVFFHKREAGRSKLRPIIILKSLIRVLELWFRSCRKNI